MKYKSNRNSVGSLWVASEFRNPGNCFCGIWNPAFWNPDRTYDWNPESLFHWQRILNPVAGIRNPRRGIQNPGLSWFPLYGVTRRLRHFALKTAINSRIFTHFKSIQDGGAVSRVNIGSLITASVTSRHTLLLQELVACFISV